MRMLSSQSGRPLLLLAVAVEGGAKLRTWEGGHRVIGAAYWRGVITPRMSDALVWSLDFLPTFAALAEVRLPDDRVHGGIDIA